MDLHISLRQRNLDIVFVKLVRSGKNTAGPEISYAQELTALGLDRAVKLVQQLKSIVLCLISHR